jgi:hypothetical protein
MPINPRCWVRESREWMTRMAAHTAGGAPFSVTEKFGRFTPRCRRPV